MNLLKLFCVCLLSWLSALSAASPSLDLSGEWQVSLEAPSSPGAKWRPLHLPGTLTDAGIGAPLEMKSELTLPTLAHLQAKFSHVGAAWYRRSVEIPSTWSDRRIVFEMERVLWKSEVWIDGRYVGSADSLVTPHRYDLTPWLPAGRHELVVRIDNREIHPGVSHRSKTYHSSTDAYLAHAYTNHTQTLWNGMLGTVQLRAEPIAAIAELGVFPSRHPSPSLRIEGRLSWPATASAGRPYRFIMSDAAGHALAETTQTIGADGSSTFAFEWFLPAETAVRSWNEFTPVLYRLEAIPVGSETDSFAVRFGFRDLQAAGSELQLDGRRIFLRGTLECAVFPLTGYPPTDRDTWRGIMQRAKEWGLNHLRFHSWCPPAAAFEAADELGVYLQIELPHWSLEVGKNTDTWSYLQAEASRMLATYGNHPSFMFLSLGNELQGDMKALDTMVRQLRIQDNRRLYTSTTFTFEKGYGRSPAPDDQYFVTQYTTDGWLRGQGIFNEAPPAFDVDYRDSAKSIRVPLVSHEIGQYAIYPDLREIERYTGNLRPLNFIAVREDLAGKGLLELASQFTQASGEFAALLYKEEIERALRTAELDGFQLLGLQDFPGQGTALVGLLNAFWESKNIMPAERFREFCGPVVPLARFPKAVYERSEVFRARLEVANFASDLSGALVRWNLRTAQGTLIKSGTLAAESLRAGAVTAVGEIEAPIPAEGEAEAWELAVSVDNSPAKNRWKIWVYPPKHVTDADTVRVVTSLDEAMGALRSGAAVLFAPPLDKIKGLPGRFVPVFWSPVHFPDQPGTMGLLCDPQHPALQKFPTESHSDWQWWDPILHSRSVVIDGLPVTPIVRVIDNFGRNHALANVFEAKIGTGRLLFCAIDVTSDLEHRPVARQLRASLLSYMRSETFHPTGELSPEQLKALLLPTK